MNLFEQYLSDWTSGMEKKQTRVLPVCDECSSPFSGQNYGTGNRQVCGSCAQQNSREEMHGIAEHQRKVCAE